MRLATVLSIGGSDPSGCGGIQGDLKVFTHFGLFGMAAVTSITCQNSQGVRSFEACRPDLLKDQLAALIDDIPIDAVKIGMLGSPENTEVIADIIREKKLKNIVLDPVLASSSGRKLMPEEGNAIIIDKLIPLVKIVTPNLSEASIITNEKVLTPEDMKKAATIIKDMGPEYVLVKGGHLEGNAIDILYDGRDFLTMEEKRISGGEFRGTGCALSSAIAAGFAEGLDIEKNLKRAKSYITKAMENAYHGLGTGMGILNHNFEKGRR